MDVAAVQARIREFVAERDWEPFHTPKNADVLVDALRLADLLGVDIWEAVDAKLRANALRHPAETVRVSLDRYRDTHAGGRDDGDP